MGLLMGMHRSSSHGCSPFLEPEDRIVKDRAGSERDFASGLLSVKDLGIWRVEKLASGKYVLDILPSKKCC
jgi:hypothetical protein